MSEIIREIFQRFLLHSWKFDPNPQNMCMPDSRHNGGSGRQSFCPVLLFLAFMAFLS